MTATYTLFHNAADAWSAMLADCANAHTRIDLDQYILARDKIGAQFLNIFIAKSKQNVQVSLLLDYIGSIALYYSPETRTLKQSNARLHFYNSLSRFRWLMPLKWLPRNHAKVIAIDEDIIYIGSACIRDDMSNWRDTTIRLQGEGAKNIMAAFRQSHKRWWPSGIKAQIPPAPNPMDRPAKPDINISGSSLAFVVHNPARSINPIYREILWAIKNAKHRICITTPYFTPPRALKRQLKLAALRGVKVDIIINQQSDIYVADLAAQSYLPSLIKNKINVHLFIKGNIMHAKNIIIDETWASLGSTNLDHLSLNVNREANLIIRSSSVCQSLLAQFESDLKNTNPANAQDWYSRPLLERLLGYLARSIKGVL